MKSSETPLLEVKDLDVAYGTIQSLWNINIKVDRGMCVSLLGLNGAGKSTLLKSIMGFLCPKKGSIIFKGKIINSLEPWQRARMGIIYVPEGRGIFARLTVKENLLMGCYSRKKRAREILREVYRIFPILEEREDQEAGTLSGGEQQMLAIARGLMADPELLMLDEVTQGLAPTLRETIYEKIKEIKDLGITIILVDEYLKKSIEISDYIYLLTSGHIVLEGYSAEIIKDSNFLKKYFGV